VKTKARPRVRGIQAFLVLGALAVSLTAYAALARTGDAEVAFTAVGPGGLRIVGKTKELSLSEANGTLSVTVPLAGLKTGIDLRDRHLRDKYLHVGTYAHAQLEVPRAALRPPAPNGSITGEADGTLRLHGQARRVHFRYSGRSTGSTIRVEASFRLDIRDFGIEIPSYMGLRVRPEVDVSVQFQVAEAGR
jgi:polyisoprenoid-binding protein YceI